MKQHFLFRLFLYVLLPGIMIMAYSCKKDNDTRDPGSGYYIRFKINGTQVEYKGQVEGAFDKATALQHNTSLAGLKEALVATKNNMTLLLATDNETQTGLGYTSYTTGTSGMQKAKLVNLVYIDENGKNYLSWMEEFAPALPPGTETKAIIKITEATADYMKGDFSGVLYDEAYTVKFNITDGEFYARRFN
ncbi:hypothetical protein [Agriterribacter sp.]|uniref:hypothetical protein n=1 Tax=Agriterribacter sp. TaxID=2821509 RepID=UPI002BDF1F34|nr:hypothetical protein [Agriterribacter sp.]HRO45470.1 hypothetical protein [Agriterribacter sp.]HRQ18887.1 hypothetical protein [Agriterribacter sp.]